MEESPNKLAFSIYGDSEIKVDIDGEMSLVAVMNISMWCMESVFSVLLKDDAATADGMAAALESLSNAPYRAFYNLLTEDIPEEKKEIVAEVIDRYLELGEDDGEEEVEADSE